MITTRLYGGLGNNLFQLANVYAIHKCHDVEYCIPTTAERGGTPQSYGQRAELEFDELFENKFNYCAGGESFPSGYVNHDEYLHSTTFEYREVPFLDNCTYSGYFQSHKYFRGIDIKNEFKINQYQIDKIYSFNPFFKTSNTVSLHYRLGGDRISSQMQHYHKNVSLEYYKKALEIVTGGYPDRFSVVVFSDRIDDAMNNLSHLTSKYNFIPVGYGADKNVEEFIFMSLCKDNIIGNSTFSWWAAYMNKNINKMVIAPKSEWFGPGYKHFNLNDCFPDSWITL